mmetsp:Transcript_3112/g.7566  ORF Transcript_3112/g.7566 Transcript_3112/m.7566 type:complete len:648 (-) Transcript_3112:75-2018(-)|eukprot:CAMPEP_0114547002 /NCGR_PEP_ID=MMETSP0114-20121206/4234_1 /TAXON_ID=31324 /ORGANISM="Goniomonas sp, Strain m" /LENGTH=647 /DNA_ID=CAMNT_0001731533 /DNA_START=5 /DNA_END=1948 /DNA_ORIENTATION=-
MKRVSWCTRGVTWGASAFRNSTRSARRFSTKTGPAAASGVGAKIAGGLLGGVLASAGLTIYSLNREVHAAAQSPASNLPVFKLEEVEKHNSRETGAWVSYKGDVYDITKFLDAHPGGTTRLLMAAGGDLEPFWNVYRQHYRGHILDFIQRYKIGRLSPSDAKKASSAFEFGDMYTTDPERHPDLLGCTYKPWCGETRTERLTENYYTPNELFYVRNHLAVPVIDEDEYRLIVKGIGLKRHTFTLKELKTLFPKYEVVSTLQCAGNRREDMHGTVPERGIFISPHWIVGAISNAKWGGCRVRDVLAYCGMDVDGMALGKVNDPNIKHVQWESYDTDETGYCYGSSVPIDKVVDGLGDALFAYEMNGQTLPRDHGYPVRVLCPGHAGARQAKWVHKCIVASDESQKTWQIKSYRGFAPDQNFPDHLSTWGLSDSKLRLDQAPIVQEMPVQSLVCNPPPNYTIAGTPETIRVKGVAWCGGGRGIGRVDVCLYGGTKFVAAELTKPIEQRRNRDWGWYHFHQDLPLSKEDRAKLAKGEKIQLDIVSKAMSGDFQVQPERMEPYWNARGVCINHWYHVPVSVDPKASADVRGPIGSSIQANTPSGGSAGFNVPWQEHGWDNKDLQATPDKSPGARRTWPHSQPDQYPRGTKI